ncbi:MAG: hypothetical protein MUC87_15895 [Bacteroidia bacterium]|jgi:hypothetical protein|nr:hypothetical protein [Bacteroidia bacterium]
MKQLSLFAILTLLLMSFGQKPLPGGEQFLRRTHKMYAGKWYNTLTFEQTTHFYQNGVKAGTQTWYEAGIYPNLFRIDFGSPDSGDAYISRHDTAYLFRRGKLSRTMPEVNELLFLFGGMYHYPADTAVKKITAMGYNLSETHSTTWKGRKAQVVGAKPADTLAPQIWFDLEHRYVVRIIRNRNGHREEIISRKHIPLGGAWCETEVVFYMDGKLIQEEFYTNCRANDPLDPRIFEPAAFGQVHWMKK